MTIVVVSPHRGDAAFSLGLAIDAWLASGHAVVVLNCFTQSAYAPYSDVEALHPNDRVSFVSAVRRREDVAWNKLAGTRLRLHDLDLLDAPIRLGCDLGEVLSVEIRPGDRAVTRIAGALSKLLRTAPAAGIAVAVPLALGEHIDHRVVREAALSALQGPAAAVAFYEDLPFAAREGHPTRLSARVTEMAPGLIPAFVTAPAPEPSHAVDRKTRLAECYDSQVDSGVVRQMAEFARQYGGRERLWGNAAWRETGLTPFEEPSLDG